jgi:hypothetical protein
MKQLMRTNRKKVLAVIKVIEAVQNSCVLTKEVT